MSRLPKGYQGAKEVFRSHGLRIIVMYRKPKTERGQKEIMQVRLDPLPNSGWSGHSSLAYRRRADILFERPRVTRS